MDAKTKKRAIGRMSREVTQEVVQRIEAAGVPIETLSDEETDRLCSIVLEEGDNILGRAAVEAKRLEARGKLTAATKEELSKRLLAGVGELAVRRFLAGRAERHGP